MNVYANRVAAGRRLADALTAYRDRHDVVVLGLPRGGVPVAFEVARALNLALDVLVVRKVGMPEQPELALGAVASGGEFVANEDLAPLFAGDDALIKNLVTRKLAEAARRERLFRADRPPLTLEGRTAILVDDGAATGSSMLVAIQHARKLRAKRVVVALPVAAIEAYRQLEQEADAVICLMTPSPFSAVGNWYAEFSAVEDHEVSELLEQSKKTDIPT